MQPTTTYNELKELGACQDGLDKLLGWCKKHPDSNTGYGNATYHLDGKYEVIEAGDGPKAGEGTLVETKEQQ